MQNGIKDFWMEDGVWEGLELECADVLPALGAGGGLSGDPAMSEP